MGDNGAVRRWEGQNWGRLWRRARRFLLGFVLLPMLAACGGADPTPTATPAGPTATASPTAPADIAATPAVAPVRPSVPAAGRPSATFPPGTTQEMTDGTCATGLPLDWTTDGVGGGRSPGGSRARVFGNRIAGDAAWERALTLFLDRATARGATVSAQGADFALVTEAEGRGFAYRGRFGAHYCDLILAGPGRSPLPEADDAAWPAIAGGLGVVPVPGE